MQILHDQIIFVLGPSCLGVEFILELSGLGAELSRGLLDLETTWCGDEVTVTPYCVQTDDTSALFLARTYEDA